jgi:predicted amidohydrolase
MIEGILEKIFIKKITRERIESHIDKLPTFNAPPYDNLNRIKISAVQREIHPLGSIEGYIDMLYSFIKNAVEEGSQLVIFPEYNFFDLFGLIPGFSLLNNFLNDKAQKNINKHNEGGDSSSLAPLFKAIAPSIERGVSIIFSLLAKKANIYIYSGSFLFTNEKGLYNAGSLYGPSGEFIGTQGKLHLTDFEEQIGLTRERNLAVFDLKIGRLALPICMDATYFETFYRARELDADLVILPIANMEEYNKWRALRGIWPRIQESFLYGAKASLNGWIAGMHFTGRAGVFAPLSLTPNKDGILAISSHYEGNEFITTTIDYDKLKNERLNAQYFGDINTDFEKNFINKTYYNGGKRNEKK